MNLRLRRKEHVCKDFTADVKTNSGDWNKHEKHPIQGASCQNVIGNHCELRKRAWTRNTECCVKVDGKQVKGEREEDDTMPRVGSSAPKAFPYALLARKGGPVPMNESLRLI